VSVCGVACAPSWRTSARCRTPLPWTTCRGDTAVGGSLWALPSTRLALTPTLTPTLAHHTDTHHTDTHHTYSGGTDTDTHHTDSEVFNQCIEDAVAKFSNAEGSYMDAHRWVFSDHWFYHLVETLNDLGVLQLHIETLYPTHEDNAEFYVVLSNRMI
jgi:hypothetical protein